MNVSIALAFSLMIAPVSRPQAAQAAGVRTEAAKGQLVRFSMINMSGKAREVHIRGSVVELPVGKPVVLQGKAGEHVTVLSSTDSRFSQEFVLSTEDGGRLLPIG